MLITVAICTLNRAESLRRTLDSVEAMRIPDGLLWEVLVVNNNSTDHTNDVIEAYRNRLPIRRACEPQRGASNARNRAIDLARGDYLVCTDDDVVVDRGWLAAYAEAFRCWTDSAVFGGPIIPRYELPLPKWLAEVEPIVRESGFATCDYGDSVQPLPIGGNLVPLGSNFAVRARELRMFRFDRKLGRGPGQQRACEETTVMRQILRSGATGCWIPQAKVEHCIGHERQTLRYLANQYSTLGETEAYLYSTLGETEAYLDSGVPQRLWFGVPRWLWRHLFEAAVRYGVHRLVSRPSVWVGDLRVYASSKGHLRYWRIKEPNLGE